VETETERELRNALGRLQQELSAIYASVPGIVFCVAVEPDGDFRFSSMSDGGLVAMGLTREQFVGARVRDVIPEPSRDTVLDNYREAIRAHRTVRWEEVSMYPAGERHGEVAVTPLYDENGVPTRLIGIVHDITERKAAEAAINEANSRKSDFIAAMSHELRNPLAAISASLTLMDLAAGSADATQAREIVGRQVTHMARLVDDLLDITRITHGRIELHRSSVEFGGLLRRTVATTGRYSRHEGWLARLPFGTRSFGSMPTLRASCKCSGTSSTTRSSSRHREAA
jgi:PAS domain S-box-containing protein